MNTTQDEGDHSPIAAKASIAIRTLGCKLNQAESQSLMRRLVDAGYGVIPEDQNPDIFILNTCTVTHIADRKCRHYLREFHRRNPESLVMAVGCYADRDEAGLKSIEGVDRVIGNNRKHQLIDIIEEELAGRKTSITIDESRRAPQTLSRTRSMVKIQQGCSHGCSYCIVPSVRGPEVSVPHDDVIAEISLRGEQGYREIVLTGTRIGVYGSAGTLEDLVRRMLDETGIERIRLSSLQPREITPGLISLWRENERICRHLHLALQSGSETVLRRMNRAYTLDEYFEIVRAMREAMPDMAITTDVIVGFPGESDAEFEQGYDYCREIGFARLHVFPYSSRPGTPAARMAGPVPGAVKKERTRRMLDLAQESARNFRRNFEGETRQVLWEESKNGDQWIGHTGNYLKVITQSPESLLNRLTPTRLGREYKDALRGDIALQFCGLTPRPGGPKEDEAR